MRVTIYWGRETQPIIRKKIRERFNISDYLSVNGETPADIREEDLPLLRETEKRGFIQIRNKQ